MKSFLREYWAWILIPILVIGALVTYVVIEGGQDPDASDNYEYDI